MVYIVGVSPVAVGVSCVIMVAGTMNADGIGWRASSTRLPHIASHRRSPWSARILANASSRMFSVRRNYSASSLQPPYISPAVSSSVEYSAFLLCKASVCPTIRYHFIRWIVASPRRFVCHCGVIARRCRHRVRRPGALLCILIGLPWLLVPVVAVLVVSHHNVQNPVRYARVRYLTMAPRSSAPSTCL
jgi:hypothetical protein